jgi:hypothetical protein
MKEELFSRRLKEEADRELFRGLEFGEEMKDRVRRMIRESPPERSPRRTWLWVLPALGAAAVFAGVLVLRSGPPSPPTPSFASAPEKKAPLALAPATEEAQQPASEGGAASSRSAARTPPPAPAEAPQEALAEAIPHGGPQAVEVAGARVTVGPLSPAGSGQLHLPVRVEVTAAPERSDLLLDPGRWGFFLGGRSLRPEGVVRGSDHWEGRLVLPSDGEGKPESLRLTVTWGSERREIPLPPAE